MLGIEMRQPVVGTQARDPKARQARDIEIPSCWIARTKTPEDSGTAGHSHSKTP